MDLRGSDEGYINDPDMLVGTSTGAVTLTPTQSRTQFDLRGASSPLPLLLGREPVYSMNAGPQTYGDTEVIKIDQDPSESKALLSTRTARHAPKDNWWCFRPGPCSGTVARSGRDYCGRWRPCC